MLCFKQEKFRRKANGVDIGSDRTFFSVRLDSQPLLLAMPHALPAAPLIVLLVREKYDDGRHTEYHRLNEMAHIYHALSAANN